MKILFRGKIIKVDAKPVSFFGGFRGLMFRSRNSDNLFFDFGTYERAAIHSFFVFFDFLAVWLDDEFRVVEFQIVKPFVPLIKPKKYATQLIEIPVNVKNARILQNFRR